MAYEFDDDGSVRLDGRRIPVPDTISPEARQALIDAAKRPAPAPGLADRRAEIDATMQSVNAWAAGMFPVSVSETRVGGVRCHRVVRDAGDAPATEHHNVL